MFKINRQLIDDIIVEHIGHYNSYYNDICSGSIYYCDEVEKLDDLKKVDFDNCLIYFYSFQSNKNIIFVSDDVELLSIEDKLTYVFPDDILSDKDFKRSFILDFYENTIIRHSNKDYSLCDLSIYLQKYILRARYYDSICKDIV